MRRAVLPPTSSDQGRGSRSSNDLIGGKAARRRPGSREGGRGGGRGRGGSVGRGEADARDSLDTHTEVVDGFRALPSLPYLALEAVKSVKCRNPAQCGRCD